MSDRPIWRPNAIPLAEWERLSRDDQIRWWKDREPPARPPDPLKAVTLFRRGLFTPHHIAQEIFERLTPENAAAFFAACPADVVDLMREAAAGRPADDADEAWSKLIRIGGGSYAPWVTREEIEQHQKEERRRFREGVRLFRQWDRRRADT